MFASRRLCLCSELWRLKSNILYCFVLRIEIESRIVVWSVITYWLETANNSGQNWLLSSTNRPIPIIGRYRLLPINRYTSSFMPRQLIRQHQFINSQNSAVYAGLKSEVISWCKHKKVCVALQEIVYPCIFCSDGRGEYVQPTNNIKNHIQFAAFHCKHWWWLLLFLLLSCSDVNKTFFQDQNLVVETKTQDTIHKTLVTRPRPKLFPQDQIKNFPSMQLKTLFDS